MKLTRRKFIGVSTLLAGGAYINHRGLRYPRMGFEHRAPARSLETAEQSIDLHDIIAVQPYQSSPDARSEAREENSPDSLPLRAFALEPALQIQQHQAGSIKISISNISSKARLKVEGAVDTRIEESITGLRRELELNFKTAATVSLQWQLADEDGSRFAVIGDTGGVQELDWALQRASQLQASFLLHLGDFNYNAGEYDSAIELFNGADIPVFVSIGNHDYNDSGLIYQQFLDQVSPMNHSFQFAGTRFINFDTAADFFPAYSGHRRALFDQLIADQRDYADNVFFTHRLFVDPRPGQHHIIGGVGEIDWLVSQIKDSGGQHMLTGHVHHSAEMDYEGIKQITVGEGLGFEDIVNEKRVANLLIGELQETELVKYSWQPLNMPWHMHTNPFHEREIRKQFGEKKLQWYFDKLNLTAT